MSVNQVQCSHCKALVSVPEGSITSTCPKCGHNIKLSHSSWKSTFKISIPIISLVVLLGVLLWVFLGSGTHKGSPTSGPSGGSEGPEISLNTYGDPRASYVTPNLFTLWELNPDDTVRVVKLLTESGAAGSQVKIDSISLSSKDQIRDIEIINGQLLDESVSTGEYSGTTFYRVSYTILASNDQFGFNMLVDSPPHLHKRTSDRLISIGYDPDSYCAQKIDAVAIPLDAKVTSIYDYQPYRHITLGEWDVFYYDMTNIQSHISIHITYEPAGDVLPLDWAEAESSR